MSVVYPDKAKQHFNHTFRISKEYKEKLKELHSHGIMVGKTLTPELYRAIDAAIAELRSKK